MQQDAIKFVCVSNNLPNESIDMKNNDIISLILDCDQ
jgi:hypothetical protein